MWSAARSAKISMILCMPERVSGGDAKFQGFCDRWYKWEGQPAYNTYMVRKDHILRGSRAAEGPLSLFGYVMIKPMEGDVRKNGEYRVSKETYLAIQACLLGQRPTE